MNTKHTKGPMVDEGNVPDAMRFIPLRVVQCFDSWDVWTRPDQTAGTLNNFVVAECQSKDDAAFIVQACNAHEELVAALQSCFDMLTSPKFSGWIDANCADDELWAMTQAMIQRRDEARAALAKAEGKAGV